MIKQVTTIALSVLASHVAFAATSCATGDICINNQTATATPLTTVNNIVVTFKGHDSASESCDYEITSSNSNQTSWVISGNQAPESSAHAACAKPAYTTLTGQNGQTISNIFLSLPLNNSQQLISCDNPGIVYHSDQMNRINVVVSGNETTGYKCEVVA